MKAFSPTTRLVLRTSPSTRPSTWMSPVERRVPFITRSALMTDGFEGRGARLAGAAAGAAGVGATGAASFLLENMSASLDEGARITHDIVIPNFVVHVRSGTAPGRSEFSDWRARRDVSAYLNENCREV